MRNLLVNILSKKRSDYMEPTKFSLILKHCRENAGLTQEEISTALNMERSTYAYYECGKTNPSGAFILKLAKFLNMDYRVFLEAIDDEAFDEDEDLSNYSAHSRERCRKTYELSKQEQKLIISYRAMPKEKRNEIDNICKTFFKKK